MSAHNDCEYTLHNDCEYTEEAFIAEITFYCTVEDIPSDILYLVSSSYVYHDSEKKIREYVLRMRAIDSITSDCSHNKPPLHWQGWRSRR